MALPVTLFAQAAPPPTAPQAAPIELLLNHPIERTLSGGKTDVFTIICPAGNFFHVIAEQKGIDIVLTLLDPAGKVLVAADSPNDRFGPEPASAICAVSGTYTAKVSSLDSGAPTGKYEISLRKLQASAPSDQIEINAEQEVFTGLVLANGEAAKQADGIRLIEKGVNDWSRVGDKYEVGIWASSLGLTYSGKNQQQKALQFFAQALAAQRDIKDRKDEEQTLNAMGVAYDRVSELQKALDFYNQALAIQREVGERMDEGTTLSNIARAYSDLGEKQKALDLYNQALAIHRETGDKSNESITLGSIGLVYSRLGQLQKALEFYNQALLLARTLGDRFTEGMTLHNIALVYKDLNQKEKALDLFTQALKIMREIGDRREEAMALGAIGITYRNIDQPQKALEYELQAASIMHEVGDRRNESVILNSIGVTYRDLGDKQKALEFYNRSLPLEHAVGERTGEGYTLWNIGVISSELGDATTALRSETSGLALARAVGDPKLQAQICEALMIYFRNQKRPQIAILFGVEAVNLYQGMRKNISGLDKNLQSSFTNSNSSTYRELAELLVQDDRLAEAEHVLDLLKDVELEEVVRGGPATKTDPLPLSDADRAAEASITAEVAGNASNTDDGYEFDRLSNLPAPTDADKTHLKDLATKIATKNAEMQTFFDKTLYEELGGNSKSNARVAGADTETSSLSNLLAELGPGTLALYTLAGDQHSYIIVTSATTRTRYELKANAADLGKLVLALREELRTSSSDPSKDLAALSHILLDPIAADIAAAAKRAPDKIPILLWSLDGVLRYVPMNALFDPAQPHGRQYLAERARNVVITPESRNHLLDAPGSNGLKAAAFGVSQSYLGLHALSGVPAELDAVVHDPAVPASHGPLTGQLLRDDAFTLAALETSLKQHYSVMHIASHFVFQAGNSKESYLLLSGEETGGKGFALTMSQLQTDPLLSFRGTRLLTLSACSTAEADTGGNGREIDSLGMVMQKRDAAAVLATLWDVNDASTSLLMSDFYRRWAATPGIAKIEALRQAQIAMLRGVDEHSTNSTTGRGSKAETPTPTAANYAHPYYWAPFVLIGNFR